MNLIYYHIYRIKVEVTDTIRELTMQVVDVLDIHIGGVDLLFNEDGTTFTIAEVNNNVGFASFDKAHGISTATLMAYYMVDLMMD